MMNITYPRQQCKGTKESTKTIVCIENARNIPHQDQAVRASTFLYLLRSEPINQPTESDESTMQIYGLMQLLLVEMQKYRLVVVTHEEITLKTRRTYWEKAVITFSMPDRQTHLF